MAQIAYIQYNDVVKATKNSKKKTKNTETFYKNKEFIGIFEVDGKLINNQLNRRNEININKHQNQ